MDFITTIDREDKTAKAELWFGTRVGLILMLATELWSNTLASGDRKFNLFALGWFQRPDAPQVRIFSLIILWLSIRIAVRWGRG